MSSHNGWVLICGGCGREMQKSGNEPRVEEYGMCRSCEDEIRRQEERIMCNLRKSRGRWFSNGDDDE